MKRFVDIRPAECAARFAWFDTIVDKFETHSGVMTWNAWAEFEQDYEGDQLERYRRLCPPWVFEPYDPLSDEAEFAVVQQTTT